MHGTAGRGAARAVKPAARVQKRPECVDGRGFHAAGEKDVPGAPVRDPIAAFAGTVPGCIGNGRAKETRDVDSTRDAGGCSGGVCRAHLRVEQSRNETSGGG